jgi:hypothetical protein
MTTEDFFPPTAGTVTALELLRAGRVTDAVPLLEQSAAFLLQERLERRIFHLADLRLLGGGELLDAYLSRADMLQGLGSAMVAGIEGTLRELQDITQAIRELPGYDKFLVPPDLGSLTSLGYPDLSAYIVAGDDAGWAVLVPPAGTAPPTALPLSGLTRAATQQKVVTSWFNSASQPKFDTAVSQLDDVAGWCWESCMGPICRVIPEGSRLTLLPLGPVALLPLHVASTPDPTAVSGRRYALDHLVISYAPNLRIAAFTRRPPGPAEPLAAALAPTPHEDGAETVDPFALPFSGPEVRYVGARYGEAPAILGEAASREHFLASLRRPGAVVHFAGHAHSSPTVSGAHFLRFAGGNLLPLKDLSEVEDAAAELVVLSACTSTLSTFSHPEQALTIGNVLLVAGVRGVVATMWRVIDDATSILACRFHDLARASPAQVPEALRSAQRWFRDASPDELRRAAETMGIELESEDEWLATPVAWGGFVHSGSAGARGLLEPRRLPYPRAFGYDPREVADYYSFPAGHDGSSVSIAVVDLFGNHDDADLDAYFAARGCEPPQVERIWVGSRLPDADPAAADDRVGLTAFLQVLGSVAPGANLAVYLAENNELGLNEGLSRAIRDEERDNAVICLTASVPEDEATPVMARVLGRVAGTAAAMGKVLCVPAGGGAASRQPGVPNLLAGDAYTLACSGTEAAWSASAFFEQPGTSSVVGSRAYERPEWQENALVERLAALAGASLVPDVCAFGGPYCCLVDGRWTSVGDEILAVALWAGLLARIEGAVGHSWGMVPHLYTVFGPAGALVAVPRTQATARPGWRPVVGLGAPDGDRLLAAWRAAAAPPADSAG